MEDETEPLFERPAPKNLPMVYNDKIGELVCKKIAEGQTLQEVGKLPGFPNYWNLRKWKVDNPEFAKMLVDAKMSRGDYAADQVLHLAKRAEDADKGEVPGIKTAMDGYKWYAEKANPAEYGNKNFNETKVSATSIVVHTGIVREEDIIEAEVIHGEEEKEGNGDEA